MLAVPPKADTKSKLRNHTSTLIVGIGNDGRQDDGLGWAFLDALQSWGRFRGDLVYRYQLQVEDAELISQYQQVLFVDACHGTLKGGLEWMPCNPSQDFEFTTHVLPPTGVLYLCKELYGRQPEASMMKLQGSAWQLSVGLTDKGRQILNMALYQVLEELESVTQKA